MSKNITIDSDDKNNLSKNILENINNDVLFTNGCWLSLTNNNGVFFGTDPYGCDWCANADDSEESIKSIINWLNYWDEPRTETGTLLEC